MNDEVRENWDDTNIEAPGFARTERPNRYRNRFGDGNLNGRSYGRQILGQAMMAATLSAPEDRPASLLQLLFLRGADPDQTIEFEVSSLQDGKRFSSRHVVGVQSDGRVVLDAHATFCAPRPGPRHAVSSPAMVEDPESLPELTTIPNVLRR